MGVSGTVAVASLLVAGGSASHSADAQHQAQGDAQSAQNKAAINENDALTAAKQQQDDQQKASADLAARAQARNKSLQTGAAAPNSTILTSPLGVTTAPNTGGGKTVLGS